MSSAKWPMREVTCYIIAHDNELNLGILEKSLGGIFKLKEGVVTWLRFQISCPSYDLFCGRVWEIY